MADRVYPASKPLQPTTAPATATDKATTAVPVATANGGEGNGNPKFPPTKGQLYNPANRPTYRSGAPMKRRKHSRSCCCSCCLWTILLVIILVVLVAAAGAILWVIYRPHRSTFSVSSLQLSQFNLTSSGVTSKFNLTLTTRNPNKHIVYYYDQISVSTFSNGVDIGDGSLPSFEHGTKNTTTLRAVISGSGDQNLDGSTISTLKKNENSLPVKIQLDTKVKAKIGSVKTKRIPIRVTCDGIKVGAPTGKTPATASTSDVKCKVDVRIKIWKWTI